jgi:fatty acid-binding protein DegV
VSRIAVVTDSTADFPGDAQERLGIEIVPLTVVWDRDSFRDKQDLRIADFYRLMRERSTLPTTSAPSAGVFEETYERLLGQADHVISVHLAGKLSATLDVARGAAERVGGGRVSVVDSGQTTMCLGWLAIRAAELGAEGAEPAAIVRVDVAASQGRIQKIGVAEGDAPEIMNDLVRMVGERVPGVPVDRGEIGIVLGTHAGPGVFGVAVLLAE